VAARLYRIKGRPEGKPLIALVASRSAAERAGAVFGAAGHRLASRYWPGALTLIVPVRGRVLARALHAGDSVGFRVPDHPWLLKLLRAIRVPLASTSANRSGFGAPTRIQAVPRRVLSRCALAVDGGPCRRGRASTVVDLTVRPVRVLRRGAVPMRYLLDSDGGTA